MMRRAAKLINLAALACLTAACTRMPPPPLPVTVAAIAGVSGHVKVKHAGAAKWVQATDGTRLGPRDRVWTQSRSHADIRYDDGLLIRLRPGEVMEAQARRVWSRIVRVD
jgi:hypothetical protein